MTDEPKRIELTLLGQRLTLRTEASPDYVRSLAAYIEERVAALARTGVRDQTAALSLAALDITDELFRMRDDRRREEGDVGERLGALLTLLDRVTPREPPGKPQQSA
jgi:cell division protein ZapA (FtsZ GTPase activity inhibitor)